MDSAAKQLFIKYCGNFSLMANDGVYEEYKKFNVSEDDELKWLSEIEVECFIQLAVSSDFKTCFVKLCLAVRKTKNIPLFRRMFRFLFTDKIKTLDGESQLYVIETYTDTMRAFKKLTDVYEYVPEISDLINRIKQQTDIPQVKERADRILSDLSEI